MRIGPKINLFTYLNYRSYLKDYYTAQKKSRAGFSLRTFSKKAGFGSSNILKLVMDGTRNLTEESLVKFTKGLNLNKQEQDFFRNLVYFNQAETHEKKDYYYQKLLQSKNYSNLKPMEKHQYEFCSSWHHGIVRELITSAKYNGNIELIAKSITPKLTVNQVEQSINLLEKIGFIKKNKLGQWEASNSVVTTGAECSSVTIMNYHKNLLTITRDAFDHIPHEHRDISAMILGINREHLAEIKMKVQEFRQEILKLVANVANPSEVVVLTTQLMPYTRIEEPK